ncbi:MAG TPA: AmmeMemoRadiSam system protein A [Spirochaetia bacterium]|nr:AmmeMemoRadiSam system protein A [Spirochaetia bacterium]
MSLALTEEDGQVLIETARQAITSRLSQKAGCYPAPVTPALMIPCGAFVTLKSNGSLRGCIGRISSNRSLLQTVKEVAVSSAFEDPRFPPLTKSEWPSVRIEVSVLTPFKRVRDPQSVCVGTHGVMIRRGYSSGLLLPQVATEQGWNREELLTHACRKAGLPPEAWKDPATQIEVFSAMVFEQAE